MLRKRGELLEKLVKWVKSSRKNGVISQELKDRLTRV